MKLKEKSPLHLPVLLFNSEDLGHGTPQRTRSLEPVFKQSYKVRLNLLPGKNTKRRNEQIRKPEESSQGLIFRVRVKQESSQPANTTLDLAARTTINNHVTDLDRQADLRLFRKKRSPALFRVESKESNRLFGKLVSESEFEEYKYYDLEEHIKSLKFRPESIKKQWAKVATILSQEYTVISSMHSFQAILNLLHLIITKFEQFESQDFSLLVRQGETEDLLSDSAKPRDRQGLTSYHVLFFKRTLLIYFKSIQEFCINQSSSFNLEVSVENFEDIVNHVLKKKRDLYPTLVSAFNKLFLESGEFNYLIPDKTFSTLALLYLQCLSKVLSSYLDHSRDRYSQPLSLSSAQEGMGECLNMVVSRLSIHRSLLPCVEDQLLGLFELMGELIIDHNSLELYGHLFLANVYCCLLLFCKSRPMYLVVDRKYNTALHSAELFQTILMKFIALCNRVFAHRKVSHDFIDVCTLAMQFIKRNADDSGFAPIIRINLDRLIRKEFQHLLHHIANGLPSYKIEVLHSLLDLSLLIVNCIVADEVYQKSRRDHCREDQSFETRHWDELNRVYLKSVVKNAQIDLLRSKVSLLICLRD